MRKSARGSYFGRIVAENDRQGMRPSTDGRTPCSLPRYAERCQHSRPWKQARSKADSSRIVRTHINRDKSEALYHSGKFHGNTAPCSVSMFKSNNPEP